jgi:hypothetical protein
VGSYIAFVRKSVKAPYWFLKNICERSFITLYPKDSETVAKELQTMSMGKIRAGVYHADMPDAHKENLHIEWRRGNIKVVCATIGGQKKTFWICAWLGYILAFGLGIDKADVRFVLHYSVRLAAYLPIYSPLTWTKVPVSTVLFDSLKLLNNNVSEIHRMLLPGIWASRKGR